MLGVGGPGCGDNSDADGPTGTPPTTSSGDGDSDASGTGDSSGSGDGDGDGDGDSSGDGDGDGDPTAGTTGDDSSSGGDSDGGTFIIEPDGGANAECDLWLQDCPEGNKCMPWDRDGDFGWDSAKCSTLDPNPKAPGDACTAPGAGLRGEDDCDLGDMCYEVQAETDAGVCTPMCVGTADQPSCSDPDRGCFISNEGFLLLCLQRCDPLLGDCEGDTSCLPSNGGQDFLCRLNIATDMGFYGDACFFNNACQPGLFCANSATVPGCTANACCNSYCDTTSSEPCPGEADGQECLAWFEDGMAPPGYEDVGICALP